jgi:hypothetical protein
LHETGICQAKLKKSIEAIKEKNLLDIMKIKNPNETVYELMKVFFSLLNKTNNNLSWMFLQAHLSNFNNFKKDLENIVNLEIKKELIDQGMPFKLNYEEIKISLLKINKNLVIVLDFVIHAIDYYVKKTMVNYMYSSNINVNSKLILET